MPEGEPCSVRPWPQTGSVGYKNSLTIGLIPRGWSSNADGAGNVELGNPVFSKTKELTIVFDEDGAGVVADDPKLVVPSIDALCKPKSAAVKKIIELASVRLKVTLDPEKFACCVRVVAASSDEWEEDDLITFVTQDGPEIADASEHAGRLYMHHFDEEQERDSVITLRLPSGR